jgi:hypothetical protein
MSILQLEFLKYKSPQEDPSLLKQHFCQNWDRGFGLGLFHLGTRGCLRKPTGVDRAPMVKDSDGGSPEIAPSVLKLQMGWGRPSVNGVPTRQLVRTIHITNIHQTPELTARSCYASTPP